jgi:hypothetical protein
MKTRLGFVSNSSSSSYVVLWPNKPDIFRDPELSDADSVALTNFFQGRVGEAIWFEELYGMVDIDDLEDFLMGKLEPYLLGIMDDGPDAGKILILTIDHTQAVIDRAKGVQ